MGIVIKQTGDFRRTTNYFKRVKKVIKLSDLELVGQRGVEILRSNTPRDTGRTALSWDYQVERTRNGAVIAFTNDNVQNGVPVAIVIQYGHATGSGSYVSGRDYINPAVQPLFDEYVKNVWKGVTKK